MQILVVDDDPVVLRLVSLTLSDEGYQVRTASDGVEAVQVAARDPIDLIVLDLEMPKMDGRTAFRALRAGGVTAPVLVLSAYGAHSARRELGAEAALDKPFDPFELVRRLEGLLPDGDTGGRGTVADG